MKNYLWMVCAVVMVAPVLGAQTNELRKLLPGDGDAADRFGSSVAISGSTAVIGARSDDENGSFSGSAYLFDTITGQEIAKLLPNDGASGAGFGFRVAIDGTTAVVASPSGDGAGAVYLFDTVTGQQLAKLVSNDIAPWDSFGSSVGISGTTVVVGAGYDDDFGNSSGSAYLFDTTTGLQLAKLLPADGTEGDEFGYDVAIHGTTVIVGARNDGDNGLFSGSAYLFDASTGLQTAKLLPSDGAPRDYFGRFVAIHGTRAIVGAFLDDDNGSNSGSAYLFDTTTGLEVAKLLPNDGSGADAFGGELAIHGTTAVVAATSDDDNGPQSGSAYLFDTTTGAQIAKLLSSDGVEQDGFGIGLGISDTHVIIGALNDDDNGMTSGSAYVFGLSAFPSFCDASDQALGSCPCANPGNPDSGCDISQATGGVHLDVLSQANSPANRATLQGTGFPPQSTPTALVIRGVGLAAGGPVVFGDGVRCVATPVTRLGAALAIGGTSTHTFGHGSAIGAGPFAYQLWFRNTPLSFCDPAAAFNLSNGRVLTW